MPVPIIVTLASKYYPTKYFLQLCASLIAIFLVRAFAQGRKTNRERDLHGRVILLTGGFTSTGLTLLEALSRRGAHVIALTDYPIDAPQVTLTVDALRESTKNERIFVEQCDMLSLKSVREFCTKFLVGNEHRLDAVIFAHEYEQIGPLFPTKEERRNCEEKRAVYSDSTFLMITLLLPTLLVAPAERDIRIINVVNPFYAAAVPFFPNPPARQGSQFVREGYRSLRSAALMRHLQRVLDALPSAPALDPDNASASVASKRFQKSNIVSVSVSPGFSRHDTIAPLLRASPKASRFSVVGFAIYIILQPLLRVFAKSSTQAIQTILHVLFLPTPFKRAEILSLPKEEQNNDGLREELLKPGALYSDCSVVRLNLHKSGGQPTSVSVDDGEFGGEEQGRFIWENFEESLKRGERKTENPLSEENTRKGEKL